MHLPTQTWTRDPLYPLVLVCPNPKCRAEAVVVESRGIELRTVCLHCGRIVDLED